MKIKHEEYTIYVRSPLQKVQCQYGIDMFEDSVCYNDGSFAIIIKDDRDVTLKQFENICSAHLLMTVIDWLQGN